MPWSLAHGGFSGIVSNRSTVAGSVVVVRVGVGMVGGVAVPVPRVLVVVVVLAMASSRGGVVEPAAVLLVVLEFDVVDGAIAEVPVDPSMVVLVSGGDVSLLAEIAGCEPDDRMT